MQALRNIYTVENNKIVIDLPKSFQHKSVEVIILPISEFKTLHATKNEAADKSERIKKLLSISVWSDTDIQLINESQNLINQWKIEEF
jgi:hypothetical protein